MPNSYRISLFDDGLHQVLTIPSEFSLPGRDVLLRKEGDRLIIEPIKPCSLLSVLATLDSLTEEFPDVDEGLLPLDEIIL